MWTGPRNPLARREEARLLGGPQYRVLRARSARQSHAQDVAPALPRHHALFLPHDGNRVGHWRLMELMDEYKVRGSISLTVGLCQHHAEIIEACAERKWEFFPTAPTIRAISTAPTRRKSARSSRTASRPSWTPRERACAAISRRAPRTERTMDLIAEYDFYYTCDLFQDDQPQPVKVKKGRLISLPYSLEVNDHYAYNVYGQPARQYTEILKRQFDTLLEEGEASGTVMCIPLHAYLVGHPTASSPSAKCSTTCRSTRTMCGSPPASRSPNIISNIITTPPSPTSPSTRPRDEGHPSLLRRCRPI